MPACAITGVHASRPAPLALPDIPTLVLVTAASNALVAGFMAQMHRVKRHAGYFHLLAAGAAASAAGWSLYATRLLDWSPWSTFLAANLLVAGYPLLLVFAVRRHLGLPAGRGRGLAAFAGMLAYAGVLAWVMGERVPSVLVVTGTNAVLYAISAVLLWRHARPFANGGLAIWVAVSASAAVLLARWGLVVAEGMPEGGQSALVTASLAVPLAASFVLAMAFPVLESTREEQRLAALADLDPLTGLPNRRHALRRLRDAVAAEARAPFAVVFIDLDGFKRVNDSLGHGAGDELLVGIAARLRGGCAPGTFLARLGGDEFLLLLPRGADAPPPEATARGLLDALAPGFMLDGREVFVTGSAGISLYPEDGATGRDLVRHADTAMYRAKAAGRNVAMPFHAAMGEAAVAELELEGALRHGLAHGGLRVHYQPRLCLVDGRPRGAEALVRLRLPDGTLVQPEALVPIAERTGLVQALGEQVLEAAARALAGWRAHIDPRLQVSVNVSAAQLRDAGLVAQVASVLEAHGLPGEALELELTETMLVEEPALAAERLDALRALGVRIALDDFGVGYSSLSYLLRFPIDVLKIDRGFIQRMHAEPGAEALVVTMVELGARLGIAVVAEGVEDAAWTAPLRALGCDEAQGFALARPMPEAEAEAWLRQALRPSAPAAQPHLE